jgi:L-gulonolactone oxidase
MSDRWVNWAGDQVCAPDEIARPSTERELVGTVARAAERGQPV